MVSRTLKNIFFLFLIFIVSCNVSDEEKTAQFVPFRDFLNLVPGFEWFNLEYNKYNPDANIIQQIDSLWKVKGYRFYIFANPSCNCDNTQSIFPMICKILKSSNVPDSAMFIYTMLNTSYKHPFMHKFSVKKLPSCFTEIDSARSFYFSVIDTFELYRLKYPGKYPMERIILMSLEK
ncbi:MAG: hypothetical protein CH6_2599 [Candidatus Kapaibacterium sp.]|nr:MAG: hypothetical protein CH6_2599 [Candidatus Kapabacteria bacterium]